MVTGERDCAATYRWESRAGADKSGPGVAADNATRSFLTDPHGKTAPKVEFYRMKMFLLRFCVSTTTIHVKGGKDKLEEACEGKKDKKAGY